MRIAMISHTDSPWTPYYARYLAQRGHEVHVVSFSPKPLAGVNVHYVGARAADGRLPKSIYLRRVPRIARLLRRLRPDVVLATYVRSNGLVGALTRSAPLVVSTRGIDYVFALPFGLGRRLTRWIAERADLLHASSPELVESLAGYGIAREKFTVIPLGTDSARFRPREGARSAGPPRIVCTRKHEALYDNATLVRALALLRREGFEFRARFVGGGSLLGAARELALREGVAEWSELLGDREHDEIPEHLRWADLYLSATTSDGAPSSLFEAMSSRLFPIVSDVRANRDWLVHRESGYLFAVGDERDCATGIRHAWSDAPLRDAAGQRNRALVAERLDRTANLRRLEELLERAAALRP